ncbi:MAG: hypothetical protein K5770_18210, partial [Lachnospiraceae bacterium]|nr:hypothetical protein [Lachnospiraceae bacterium]
RALTPGKVIVMPLAVKTTLSSIFHPHLFKKSGAPADSGTPWVFYTLPGCGSLRIFAKEDLFVIE